MQTKKPIAFVDLKRQYLAIKSEIDAAIFEVINKSAFIMGDYLEKFEEEFSNFCSAKYAIGVNSGTDALFLALKALDIGPGDEVILPVNTYFATAEAIVAAGAKPVFCDIDPQTYNIDPMRIEAVISDKTRVLMPVHFYGQPCDLDSIHEISSKYNLLVVEDAAQAHGSRYKGKPIGSRSIAACYSFYPGKNLGAYGDGGAVITGDSELANKIRALRDHGRLDKFDHFCFGYNSRLDGLQAAILSAKLPHLEEWNHKRRQNAGYYSQLLSALGEVATPYVPEEVTPNFHLYVIRIRNRDLLKEALLKENIFAGVHYPDPLHLLKAFKAYPYKEGDFPIAEKYAGEILSLPMFPELSGSEIERVVGVIERHPDS